MLKKLKKQLMKTWTAENSNFKGYRRFHKGHKGKKEITNERNSSHTLKYDDEFFSIELLEIVVCVPH